MNEQINHSVLLSAFTEDDLWKAVVEKDSRFSGKVFYAVRSTGIYCRIGCPARLPRRDRIIFYETCDQAEKAGYRSCQRCRPQDAAEPMVAWVSQACRLLESEGTLSLSELSKRLNVSLFHLQRTFKAVTGVSPHQYSVRLRSQRLKVGLRNGQNVTEAQYEAGFGSSSRLYGSSIHNLGMTPGIYRQGGKNMMIAYTIVDDSLVGRVLVAGTERGICAVAFGSSDSELIRALAAEYPSAELTPDGENLTAWVKQILNHLRGSMPHLELPIDVQATAFQQRVWEELRKIPYGETRTYAEVAEAIGRPSAVRAVARACATNPVALVNPCHRVLRSDGGLGGYRWGIERKEALLTQEKEHK